MGNTDFSKLKRPIYEMPGDVKSRLEENNLMEAYKNRPPYQQNDYLWWITTAKKKETREKRLSQMIKELIKGDLYMNMKWSQ